jgi:flagellar motility protein MotE (MotC chaperone)
VIVTRRRRKPFPWRRLILPVVAIALVAFAIAWPPSRNVVTGGPLSPLWQNLGARFTTVAAPFHFAAQNQLLTDRNRQIAQLQSQITDLQSQSAAKDKQISSLNAQISQLQSQAASSRSAPSPAANAASAASAGSQPASGTANAGSDPPSNATTEMRRTAQVWANMEPENAAKVVERLPVPYVAQVLALMSPDDAGAILDAVPPAFAAQLTQENPGLKT